VETFTKNKKISLPPEQLVRQNHEYDLKITESLPGSKLILDENLTVISAMGNWFGKGKEKIKRATGKHLGTFLPASLVSAVGVLPALKKVAKTGKPENLRRIKYEVGGNSRFLDLKISKIPESKDLGFGPRILMVLTDVSPQIRIEQDLYRSERLAGLGQLATGIAHEVRNPLAIILGHAETLLLDRESLNEKQARALKVIIKQVERATGVVENLHQFAQGEEDQSHRVDINALLKKRVEDLSWDVGEGEIDFQWDLAERPLYFWGSELRVNQVMGNLIKNAVDAIKNEPAPAISIRTKHHEVGKDSECMTALRIQISNNGPSIPKENLEKIFDPFFTTKPEGWGLGLAICYNIVTDLNGVITINNAQPRGVCVKVFLPSKPGK